MDMVKPYSWIAALLTGALSLSVDCAESRASLCGTEQWDAYIKSAANRFQLLPDWLHAIMRAESGGCERLDGIPITSDKGAMGLMQLMPITWQTYREVLKLGDDPYDPYDNILAGTAYLKALHERFGWPGAAAAYHAGPSRYEDQLSTGRELPPETVEYLARIDRFLDTEQREERSLFVVRSPLAPAADLSSDDNVRASIFVVLRHAQVRAGPSTEVVGEAPSASTAGERQERNAAEEWKAR